MEGGREDCPPFRRICAATAAGLVEALPEEGDPEGEKQTNGRGP